MAGAADFSVNLLVQPTSTSSALVLEQAVLASPLLITAEIYAAKVSRWRLMWPRLKIVEWNDA